MESAVTRLAIVLIALLWAAGQALAQPAKIKIPKSTIEPGWKAANCDVELEDEDYEAENLGKGLKLVEVYCWRAAYQAGSIYFAVDPKAPEEARLLRFTIWDENRLVQTLSLTSPAYDPRSRRLGMAHKGRGMGDCGSVGEWKWTGKDFRLIAYWNKDECDGKPFDDNRKWLVYPSRRVSLSQKGKR
jgi:hypothetical protein